MGTGRKFPVGPVVSFATVAAACFAYLSLANDTKMWPYGGPPWVGLAVGGIFALLGLGFCVFRERGFVQRPVWWTTAALALVLVGSAVATTAVAQMGLREPAREHLIHAGSAPSITIDSSQPGDTVRNPTRLSGRFDTPLRAGETLWVIVGHGDRVENRPAQYQLLTGPCGRKDDESRWACPDYPLVFTTESVRNVTYYFIAVDSTRTREFNEDLQAGARIDLGNTLCAEKKICLPDRLMDDPRAGNALPGGEGYHHLTSLPLTVQK